MEMDSRFSKSVMIDSVIVDILAVVLILAPFTVAVTALA